MKQFAKKLILSMSLTATQILGNAVGTAIVLYVGDLPEYIDGKPTGKIIGTLYDIVAIDNSYQKLRIKVKGGKPILTNEQIQQKGGQVKVSFKNLTGKLYFDYKTNDYALSCSADAVEVI